MNFELRGATTLGLQPQTQWLWYSNRTNSVITGDEKVGYAISVANPNTASRIDGSAASNSACNLPISESLYDEFLGERWHGFKFLSLADYTRIGPTGDILRTLVFGPNYNTYVEHPASGVVFGLQSGSMQLIARDADAFKVIKETRTRGRAALCFTAHPSEPLIVYGDNYGTFHAHRFEATAFGKAHKIAEKQRNANRAEFFANGTKLAIGGMGYLATLAYDGKKFAPLHELSVPVRDFLCRQDDLFFVNHGMHGFATYRYGSSGFTRLAEGKPAEPIEHLVLSADLKHLAVTHKDMPKVTLFDAMK
jgi:hypothetical protein